MLSVCPFLAPHYIKQSKVPLLILHQMFLNPEFSNSITLCVAEFLDATTGCLDDTFHVLRVMVHVHVIRENITLSNNFIIFSEGLILKLYFSSDLKHWNFQE